MFLTETASLRAQCSLSLSLSLELSQVARVKSDTSSRRANHERVRSREPATFRVALRRKFNTHTLCTLRSSHERSASVEYFPPVAGYLRRRCVSVLFARSRRSRSAIDIEPRGSACRLAANGNPLDSARYVMAPKSRCRPRVCRQDQTKSSRTYTHGLLIGIRQGC